MEVVANNKNDPQHNSYYPLDEKDSILGSCDWPSKFVLWFLCFV